MKFIILFICLGSSISLFANSIDNIKTDKDVESFLKRVNKEFNSNVHTKLKVASTGSLRKSLTCDSIFIKWRIRNWEKADFNEDGLTDMLVTALWYGNYEIYVVVDKGNDSFQFIKLSNVFANCEFAKPVKKNGKQYLLFYTKRELEEPTESMFPRFNLKISVDTLVYKFGGFVEVQKDIDHYEIDSIYFCFSNGWSGISPTKKLKLLNDGSAQIFIVTKDSASMESSKFINEQSVTTILNLINYIGVKNLKDRYKAPRTDMTTKYLTIFFKNGGIKKK